MNKQEINEIIECLPRGRTPFYYFKDRYALMLMSLAFAKPATKAEVRDAGFGRLLEKPVVKQAMGTCGSAKVSADVCDVYWPDDYNCYVLSLGTWGSRRRWYDQTSRCGYNLVLQLNFSMEHTSRYYEIVDPERNYPFEYRSHPISDDKRRTLAWSRMDIELASDEALIEEIQNDWLRKAIAARRRADKCPEKIWLQGKLVRSKTVIKYFDEVLVRHLKVWDEAMLAATIWFLRTEIGVSRIFYHAHGSGSKLKRIRCQQPPRSLYTTLPRKFCFAETDEHPTFLERHAKGQKARRALNEAKFQSLNWEQ
jgi:hypothetical protein